MFEVVIKGKFTTGTTQSDPEEAKEACRKLLRGRLKEAGLLEPSQIFQWHEESVEVDKP